ncbi:MAG TPA: oxygen-dependent coproporphyrinogen oxidase [Prolixibacteraceae bacterium]|nr:oxygen-dependent coproporphyrinogen oxidase [Prolixibacteraceae bacterium]
MTLLTKENTVNVSNTAAIYKSLQTTICRTFEQADGTGKFTQDEWQKEIGSGLTCVMQNGSIIEKAGVNFSHVSGIFSENMAKLLGEKANTFEVTGVSSIIHSGNPFVPTIHMNVRHFSLDNGSSWFGGGIDLTPTYINAIEARWFHQTLKDICDRYDTNFYPEWKTWADDYFYLTHRHETRGVGGIFFDRMQPANEADLKIMLNLTCDLLKIYPVIYSQLMKDNGYKPFTAAQKKWQKIRRGRYVEFNLIHDRGTKFGLETDGNIESILVSLPAEVEWVYQNQPEAGSPEAQTQELLKKGIDWVKG